jgi:hypothetical protein
LVVLVVAYTHGVTIWRSSTMSVLLAMACFVECFYNGVLP